MNVSLAVAPVPAFAAAAGSKPAAAMTDDALHALLYGSEDGVSMQQQLRDMEYYNQQRALAIAGNGGNQLPPPSEMYTSSLFGAPPSAFGVTPNVPSAGTPGTSLTVPAAEAEETPSVIVDVRNAADEAIMEGDDEEAGLAIQGVVEALTRNDMKDYVPQIVQANARLAQKGVPPEERVAKLVKLNNIREAKEAKGK